MLFCESHRQQTGSIKRFGAAVYHRPALVLALPRRPARADGAGGGGWGGGGG
jgi:hypothetical protein